MATDGYKLTLGDTTLALYLTPGHTPGTISTIIPVRDGSNSSCCHALGWDGLQLAQRIAALHPAEDAGDVLV